MTNTAEPLGLIDWLYFSDNHLIVVSEHTDQAEGSNCSESTMSMWAC